MGSAVLDDAVSSGPSSSPARALWRNRLYRRLFAARTISNLGNGIGPIALAFGVLDLPGASAASLSVVLAAGAIPVVLMLPFGGVIADRLGRARVIAVTDIALAFVVALEAVLFLTGTASVGLLAVLSALAGLLVALWYPAFGGLVPDVVGEQDLQSGNAFVAVASNGGLILGNAVGGLLVASLGSGVALMVDAVTFAVAGLLVMSIRHVSTRVVSGESVVGDLVHGWRVFVSFRWVVVVVVSFSFVVMVLRGAEEVLGPVLARQEYGGPAGWAVVLACQSVGLLVGAVAGSRLRPTRPVFMGLVVSLVLPVWLVSLAFAAPLAIVALGGFAWGLAGELFYVWWLTALQTSVPRDALSRVSSYDSMGSLMLGPVGLALAGPLVATVGLQVAFLAGAGVVLLALGVALLSRSTRVRTLAPVTAPSVPVLEPVS